MKLGIFIQNSFSNWLLDLSKIFGLTSKFTGITIAIICFIRANIIGRALEELKNHERIHVQQYWEVTVAFLLPIVYFGLIWGISMWWILPAFVMYYVIYLLNFWWERRKTNSVFAYRRIRFEAEAYQNDTNDNYLGHRKPFAWLFIKILF